jgi:hypothetical protein
MTKTQAKKQLKSIIKILDELRPDLEDLQYEAADTAESIEPYEGFYDLTEDQQERQEWFDDLASSLQSIIEAIEDACLDDKIEN